MVSKTGEARERKSLKTRKFTLSEDCRIMSASGWSKGDGAQVGVVVEICETICSISISVTQILQELQISFRCERSDGWNLKRIGTHLYMILDSPCMPQGGG